MKNIMKLFLYAALPLALIALGSCSYPKNITFKADSQTGALSGRMEHNTNGWTPAIDGDWDIFG